MSRIKYGVEIGSVESLEIRFLFFQMPEIYDISGCSNACLHATIWDAHFIWTKRPGAEFQTGQNKALQQPPSW